MNLNLLILPLLTILIIGILGRYLGSTGILKILIVNFLILINIVLLLLYENYLNGTIIKIPIIKNIMNTDLLNVNWYFYLDDLSQLMLFVVIGISFIVLIYSYDYMISDPHIIRFYLFIVLFVFFMIILITTNSLPILFIGWEGVGLSSFLLISFWFTRFQAQLGSLLALLMNRIGDMTFLLGIFLSIAWLGSLDLISISTDLSINWDYILISFFIAAMAKSAQVYLHLWLPYSMEGPTPVSALIHAATMVTAGVFLLLRLNQLAMISYWLLLLMLIIGGLTAFIGGTLALVSLDLKELIAYSTMSQLGYMVTILGLKGNNLSFFHLVFHAYFKALLFLTAGAIIHTILDLQDFRKTGGLFNILPVQSILSIIGLTSLIGFPFTTGFYSKESILNNSYSIISLMGQYVYLILVISALLTIIYSYRFFYIIFLGETKLSIFAFKHLHYFSLHLLIPLIFLSILTILIGFIFSKWIHFNNSIFVFSFSFNIPLFIKSLPIFFMIIVILFYYFIYNSFKSSILLNYGSIIFRILYTQYSFSLIYKFISGFFFAISYRIFFKLFDYGFIDLIGPITGLYLEKFSNFLNIENKKNNFITISSYSILYLISLLLFILFLIIFI